MLRMMGGLLLGMLVGAGLVLLFVPRSGDETQRLIQARVDAIRGEGKRAAETRRRELQAQFEVLTQPTVGAS